MMVLGLPVQMPILMRGPLNSGLPWMSSSGRKGGSAIRSVGQGTCSRETCSRRHHSSATCSSSVQMCQHLRQRMPMACLAGGSASMMLGVQEMLKQQARTSVCTVWGSYMRRETAAMPWYARSLPTPV
jgi:hypothetical protein